MTDHSQLCQQLEQLWHREFPITQTMQVGVASFVDHTLETRTPLAPNRNVHNSAFAGSLYSIQALTAWGLLYLELQLAGIEASIIHADGNIKFASTVTEAIVARSSFADHMECLEEVRSTGKTRLVLSTDVIVDGTVAAAFSGTYLARRV